MDNDRDGSDVVREALTTSEHHNLGAVLDTIGRLEQLRSRGLSHEKIAERMRLTHPERPGGGVWTPAAVAKVLEIVDAHRGPTAPHSHRVDPQHRDQYPDNPPRSAPQPASVVNPRLSHEPHLVAEPAVRRRRRRRSLALVAAVAALVVAVAAVGAWDQWSNDGELMATVGLSDDNIGDAGSTEDDDLSSDDASADETSGVAAAVDVAGIDGDDEIDGDEIDGDDADADEADMLTIRIEPSSDGDGNADGPGAATATIRDDGRLHVEGSFASQVEADTFLARAADVFGEANIVRSFEIDPDAPAAEISDVALDKPVLFESGSATIDPEYIPFLEACGDVLKLNPQIVMSISAYTDSSGSEEFNLELSRQRANAIVEFYESIDIAAGQLAGSGFGELDPMADNTTEEGRSQNRRAMLRLLNIMET